MKRLTLLPLALSLLCSLASADEAANYERAAEYSAGKRGSSLLVMKEGKVVFERYAEGRTPDEATQIYSGTKSFWGVAVMVAVGEGKLSLDELASDTLQEWKTDPRKAKITLRQLLDLTSGLDPAARKLRSPKTTRKYETALAVETLSDPGQVYRYGPSHFYALGELLKRKLGVSPLAYLKEKLLDPIGLEVGSWKSDAAGDPHMPAGASLNAREWIKFGELIRLGGAWQGKQLVQRDLLTKCFQGSKANPAYGLTFWLPAAGLDPSGAKSHGLEPKDLVFAAGFANQRLYVLPSQGLVVVRQGKNHMGWSDGVFLARLLGTPDPKEAERKNLEAKAGSLTKKWFERWDTDGDGVVKGDEIPRLQSRRWGRWDTDGDGELVPAEVLPIMERRLRLLGGRSRD
jgi:CubicO group peptidase (beta-lactamase class C family)